MASVWSGQNEDICPSIKKSMYKPKKVKKLALNSQLLTVQILTNGVQVLILCLSCFITTVHIRNECKIAKHL